MKKEVAKDIAIALIAKSGYCFDGQAFTESSLSEKDQEKILYDIQIYCEKVFDKIEKKYGGYGKTGRVIFGYNAYILVAKKLGKDWNKMTANEKVFLKGDMIEQFAGTRNTFIE